MKVKSRGFKLTDNTNGKNWFTEGIIVPKWNYLFLVSTIIFTVGATIWRFYN